MRNDILRLDSDIIGSVLKKCIELFEQEQKADFPKDGIN